MKFSDLFLPKLARSNPETRKDAVRKEKSIPLLKKVAENDSDPSVRELAIERIQELEAA